MSDDEKEHASLLKALQEFKEKDGVIFTRDQAEIIVDFADAWANLKTDEKYENILTGRALMVTIVEVASVWVTVKGAGRFSGWLWSALKWFLLFSAAMVALKTGFVDWTREALSK